MRKMTWLVLVLMLVGSFASVAMAHESPWASETTTKGKMLGKLDYGVKNLFFGWTEFFKHPYAGYKEDEYKVAGTLKGLGYGLVYGALDTVGGAVHVLTFPIPIDVPLPEGGVHFAGDTK